MYQGVAKTKGDNTYRYDSLYATTTLTCDIQHWAQVIPNKFENN
jgi:hypothetical protein